MSGGPDWRDCLYRPSMLCGEKLERRGAGTVDMGEVMREWLAEARPPSQPQDGHPEAEGPPAEAPTPAPAALGAFPACARSDGDGGDTH